MRIELMLFFLNLQIKKTGPYVRYSKEAGIYLDENNSKIYLEDIDYKPEIILTSPRIGISKAKEKLWRFYF